MTSRCEYCGRELPTKTAYGLTIPMPCQCEGAVAERERLDLEERRESWKEAYGQALSRACIPSEYNVYREWGDGGSLYIYGKQGRGKSERACGALRKWLKDGVRRYEGTNRYYPANTGRYVLMPEWMVHLRSTYNNRATTEEREMETLAGVGMLVMDDLGKGKMTDWVVEKIYLILDARFRERSHKRTVITTQYPIDELVSMFKQVTDDRMALAIRSRIEGMCQMMLVEGRDMRITNT